MTKPEDAPGGLQTPSPGGRLVVGLGNCLMRDDGVGVHAARELQRQPLKGTVVLEVGTDIFSAVPWLDGAGWVLAIDAMDAGKPPGTIYTCDADAVAAPMLPKSVHELGLLSVLEFIPKARRPRITVLGVQPAVVECGLELTPVLAQALPRVVTAAREMIVSQS